MQFPVCNSVLHSQIISSDIIYDEKRGMLFIACDQSGCRSVKIFQRRGDPSLLHSQTLPVQLNTSGEEPFSKIYFVELGPFVGK